MGGVNLHRVLTSPLLTQAGIRHVFSTREGGVSEGPYASLNCAWSTGDEPGRVRQNLARVAQHLAVVPGKLFVVSQVHGVALLSLRGDEPWDEVTRREADALLTSAPGVACGVRVADCAPVLLADARSGAVCAVHAGWRGAVARIAPLAVEALRAAAGPGAEILAAVGPHISAEAFEIGDEVAAQISAAAPGLPVVVRRPDRRPHGDLRALLDHQLRQAGVAAVDHVPGCTVLEPERFFSFRRDGARSGRLIAAIAARAS